MLKSFPNSILQFNPLITYALIEYMFPFILTTNFILPNCSNLVLSAPVITISSSFLTSSISLIKDISMQEILDPVSIIAYFSIPSCSTIIDNTLVL